MLYNTNGGIRRVSRNILTINKTTKGSYLMRKFTTKDLVFTAMIAALYTALCMAVAPLSFGLVQVRFAEALTILPVFSPIGIWGVTLGCALSNLAGVFTGANILGYMDILFGTAATLIAALLSYKLRHLRLLGLPVLSTIPPVLVNAVVIGAELAVQGSTPESFLSMFAVSAFYVGIEQIIPCVCLGLALFALLDRTGAARRCFGAVS